ncbi:hypothetical protein SLEP1_g1035 [Rubroshorea leprosula]|uniref:DDE Tnp4 domain-containing protein n=1 Tax=Rubroshorea leprosula TaxID=152421 RepID=A0AAV5HCJ6_9ROSI|nr:hypothetical protein SLEP1_g1035 [Rubroshorea leprosula]
MIVVVDDKEHSAYALEWTLDTFANPGSGFSQTTEKKVMIVAVDNNQHNAYAQKWTVDHFFISLSDSALFKFVIVHAKPSVTIVVGLLLLLSNPDLGFSQTEAAVSFLRIGGTLDTSANPRFGFSQTTEKQVMIVAVDDNQHSAYALEWTLDHFSVPRGDSALFKLVIVHAKPSATTTVGLLLLSNPDLGFSQTKARFFDFNLVPQNWGTDIRKTERRWSNLHCPLQVLHGDLKILVAPSKQLKKTKRTSKKLKKPKSISVVPSEPRTIELDWWDSFWHKNSTTPGLSIPSNEEEGFKYFFRVSKKTFSYICSLVREDLISRPPSGLINIEGRKQVVIALRSLASGDSQVSVGAAFGVGQSTVSQVTWRFIEALEECSKHHPKWPDSNRMEEIKSKFEELFGLPNCCGALDTTHIVMTLPTVQNSKGRLTQKNILDCGDQLHPDVALSGCHELGYEEQCCKQVDPVGKNMRENLANYLQHRKEEAPAR